MNKIRKMKIPIVLLYYKNQERVLSKTQIKVTIDNYRIYKLEIEIYNIIKKSN